MKGIINIKNQDGQLVVTSRQIAEDFGKMHKHVLRAIEDKISLNPILGSDKYFIESSYKDSTGKNNKEYLLTKDGFTFLVMGFTGAKADGWKLKYIEAFNKMEQLLKEPQKKLSAMEMMELQFKVLKDQEVKITEVENKVDKLEEDMPLFQIDCKELQALVRKKGTESLGGYKSIAYNDNSLRGKVYSDIQHQIRREFGVSRYEAIKRNQLEKAKDILRDYRIPTILKDEVELLNNQLNLKV